MTDPTYSADAPHLVRRQVMNHSWEDLTFIHWSFPIDVVQAVLPPGLTVHSYDGKAWVALVPFRIVTRLPGLPAVPWLSRLPETNVRTYVKDHTGRVGLWFCSLDADRLAAVVAARVSYRLPYFWSVMSMQKNGNEITYDSKRKWPAPAGATSHVRMRIGDSIAPSELTSLEHFLTARWTLFSAHKRGLHYANIHHSPWPLHRAELLSLDETVFAAAGLPSGEGDPVVHFSEGVRVRIGPPHPVR